MTRTYDAADCVDRDVRDEQGTVATGTLPMGAASSNSRPLTPLAISDFAAQEWSPDWTRLIFNDNSKEDSGVDQFRRLRSRVYQLSRKAPMQTILVSSALSGEGKSFIAANFALALANQDGRRVLLMDAHLRKPVLHQLFGAPQGPGLSELLAGRAELSEVVQGGSIANFWLLPAGAPHTNAAEMLADGRVAGLLQQLGQFFDWIVLDSPPVLPFADAVALARACDAVLLVAKAEASTYDSVQRAQREFRDSRVLGLVLNQTPDGCNGSYIDSSDAQAKAPLANNVQAPEQTFSLERALRDGSQKATGQERRRSGRHPLEVPVTLTFDNQAVKKFVTADVGDEGFAIRADRQLRVGALVKVSFSLASDGSVLATSGEVAWSHQDGRCGIRILSQTYKPGTVLGASAGAENTP